MTCKHQSCSSAAVIGDLCLAHAAMRKNAPKPQQQTTHKVKRLIVYGTCPTCNRRTRLRQDGAVATHRTRRITADWRCAGAGRKPRADNSNEGDGE